MSTITMDIPDNQVTFRGEQMPLINALIESFAIQYKRPEKITDESGELIDNPVSKGAFARGIIRQFIREVYAAANVSELDEQRNAVIAGANFDSDSIGVN